MRGRILVVLLTGVDDSGLREALRRWGYESVVMESEDLALGVISKGAVDASLLGLGAGERVLRVIRRIKKLRPRLPVLALASEDELRVALEAWRAGADCFVFWPAEEVMLKKMLHDLLARVAKRSDGGTVPPGIGVGIEALIGSSSQRELIANFVRQAAAAEEATVLLQGESGTGKELVARAIHSLSSRSEGPFVPVNCGALNENLINSEFLGHERGSFTNALARHIGYFERAHGGTILLDEVGELSPAGQVLLLRVLQERRFERVGGEKSIEVDVRVISATNSVLKRAVEGGRFRPDLYYRLAVLRLDIPPLRERERDLVLLAEHFIGEFARSKGVPLRRLSELAVRQLLGHDWPGNVRELRNVIERAMHLQEDEEIRDISSFIETSVRSAESRDPGIDQLRDGVNDERAERVSFDDLSAGDKRAAIRRALGLAKGNRAEAARLLGLSSRHALVRRMKRLGLAELLRGKVDG